MSALAIVSCVNEKHDIQEPGGRFAFTAGFISEQLPQSKVFLEHNYYKSELYVLWEKDDQVSIFDGVNNGCFISDRAGLSTSLSIDQNADFNEEADNYYALFPYDEDAAFAEENGTMYVSTTLPAEQTARRDAFSAHRAIAACTSADQNLQFRNVTAVFKATITTDGVSSITFQGKNGEVVAGDIKVSYNDVDDVGYVVVGNPSTTVTVLPEEGDTFVPGIYYFTILPGRFQRGFTVTVDLFDQNQADIVREVNDDVSIPRSSLSIGRVIGTEGDGTVEEPYLIKNKYDLEGLATIVADDQIDNETITYIRIDNDIDLASMENWTPVNNSRNPEQIAKFDIDGNDRTISNFHPKNFERGTGLDNNSGHDQPSLFGIVYGNVRDLNIIDAELNLEDEASTVGILAGWIGFEGKEATVSNVHVQGTLKGKKCVGGLSGMVRNAVITDCTTDVNVTASGEHASGFIARYYENVQIVNCHAAGTVVGTRGVGGILGFNESESDTEITVTSCSSTCSIDGNYQVGGLVGHTLSPLTISSCWVKADVTATARKKEGVLNPGKQVGGILGVAAGQASVTIRQNYYRGDITADGCFIGGILGYATGPVIIGNCHSHCNIENTGAYLLSKSKNYDMIGVGGILGGSVGSSLNIANCFVDEGEISSNAKGTLTASLMPETWSEWAESVANNKRTSYYLGGGVGGILGFVGTESGITFSGNISFITSITCNRTSAFDPPCAPIIGCISSAADFADKGKNRYYQSPDDVRMVLEDETTGYQPRNLSELPAGTLTDNIVNACDGGTNINQYCLYNRPVSNNNDNSPSDAAKNSNFVTWNTDIWDLSQHKPTLIVHEDVYNQD